MAYLMDGQHMFSQEHIHLAQDIAHLYPNLRLSMIPESERGENEEFPFALRDIETGEFIRPLRASEMNRTLIDWLWENDSRRVDTYAKFMEEQKNEKALRDAANEAKLAESTELANAIISSPLHTFKHDGKVYGDGYRASY